MVKELDDPAGDDSRSCWMRARPPTSATRRTPASSLRSRRPARSPRGRSPARAACALVVAGGDGEPATATERTAVRRLLARARPAGERPPGDLLGRLAAERIEVVTSRPAALVGAGRPRQLGVVAIDPSSFDPAVPRDTEALAALEAAGTRVVELRRQEREPEAPIPDRSIRELGLRSGLYAIVAAFGLLHARDLQIPALSTASLAAIAALATAPGPPGSAAANDDRTFGVWPQTCARCRSNYRTFGARPQSCGPRSPAWSVGAGACDAGRRVDLGGLVAVVALAARRARGSARRRPGELGRRSCCRSRAGSSRSCGRSCSSSCSRGSPRSRGCGSRARARSRPGSSHCCRSPSARPSTSCRSIHCAHSSRAGSLLAFLFTGRAAGGGPRTRRGVRGAGARDRRRLGRRARGVASGRAALDDVDVRGRRRPARRRSGVGHELPPARLPREARGGASGARPRAAPTGGRSSSPSSTARASRARSRRSSTRAPEAACACRFHRPGDCCAHRWRSRPP